MFTYRDFPLPGLIYMFPVQNLPKPHLPTLFCRLVEKHPTTGSRKNIGSSSHPSIDVG